LRERLVVGILPGISRQPAKKLKPDQTALLGLLRRWQDEANPRDRHVLAQPLQHGEIGGPVLGVGEPRRRAFGVPMGERGAAVVGHAGGDQAVGVPVLEPVLVQQFAEGT
jgi:hypothetical protein